MSCQNSISTDILYKFNNKKESITFKIDSSCKWYDTKINLKPNTKYIFTAVKEEKWNDANIKTNACGYKPSDLKWYNPSRYALGLADKFEAKRFPTANWFEVIGCICNDSNNCQIGQCFRMFNCDNQLNNEIITKEFQTFKEGGRLLCYANDNSYFYFNNKGSISITIKEK